MSLQVDHISLSVADLNSATKFYDAIYYAAFITDPAGNKIEAVCHSL